MSRSAKAVVCFAGVIIGLQLAFPCDAAATSSLAAQQVVAETNQARARAGLPPLQVNAKLSQVARIKASDMALQNYFSHKSSKGTKLPDILKRLRYTWRACAENIAATTSAPGNVVAMWLGSASHKKNILSAAYRQIGVGVASGELNGQRMNFVVQEFGTD